MTCKRYSYKWPGLAKFTEALASYNNNPTATAKHFGVSKSTIYEWIKANGLQNSEETIPAQALVAIDPALCEFNINQLRSEQIGDTVWFVLADVCAMVDYTNPSMAAKLVKPDDLTIRYTVDSLGRKQELLAIRESGLYRFLVRCQLPKADAFEEWVTGVVLPSIRKTGSYSVQPQPQIQQPTLADLAQLVGLRTNEIEALAQQNRADIQEMRATVATMPTVAADEVIARLQAVDTLKTHLHDLVDAIVKRASEFPPSDPFAWQYSQYQRTWKAVHEWAQPKVKSKAEYRTTDQVLSAIRGAEMILSKLGAEIPPQPQQLRINFEHQAAG